jgi:segregation and condensation protein A
MVVRDSTLVFDDTLIGPAQNRVDADQLTLSLDGYEGPLDLLLDLARRNKLDLREISILDLADQYLAYIHEARRLKLEVAGDYLVMAAWLAYLKSRMLLPQKQDEPDGQSVNIAAKLAEKLQRLESIRKLGSMLRARLSDMQESHGRGAGEPVIIERHISWEVSLSELIAAYVDVRKTHVEGRYQIGLRTSVPIPEARNFMERELARAHDWAAFDTMISRMAASRTAPRSARASAFAASLELVRDGRADIRQEAAFESLFLRKATRDPLIDEVHP